MTDSDFWAVRATVGRHDSRLSVSLVARREVPYFEETEPNTIFVESLEEARAAAAAFALRLGAHTYWFVDQRD